MARAGDRVAARVEWGCMRVEVRVRVRVRDACTCGGRAHTANSLAHRGPGCM